MSIGLQVPPQTRVVVGITGRIGTGKTSAATYLKSRYGFQYVRYSQVLSDWLARGVESKAHLQEIGWKVMAEGMQLELNRRLIAQVAPHGDVTVDGLRHPIDRESLASSFSSAFHLVYIESPTVLRWQRLENCGKYSNLDEFERADSYPVEQQIESLRLRAEVVLRNEGALKDLYVSLDKVISNFRPKGDR